MWRVAALFWVLSAPVVAGVLARAAPFTPSLQAEAGEWIVIAAIVGAVVAIPVSWTLARLGAGRSA
jgi:hypothetical protein